MLYWVQLNDLSIYKNDLSIYKNDPSIYKSKYPSLNTCQVSSVRKAWECNIRGATRGVLGSQVKSPMEVTFLSEYILLLAM